MKIYISEELGSIYHLEGEELAFTPLGKVSMFYHLGEDGGIVDWDAVAGEKTKDGQDITALLEEIKIILLKNR